MCRNPRTPALLALIKGVRTPIRSGLVLMSTVAAPLWGPHSSTPSYQYERTTTICDQSEKERERGWEGEYRSEDGTAARKAQQNELSKFKGKAWGSDCRPPRARISKSGEDIGEGVCHKTKEIPIPRWQMRVEDKGNIATQQHKTPTRKHSSFLHELANKTQHAHTHTHTFKPHC